MAIFAWIFQWGDNPVDKEGLVFMAVIFTGVLMIGGRFIVVVNDRFVLFKSDIWTPVKISIPQIKDVVVISPGIVDMSTEKIKEYYFDFTGIAIKIRLKTGKAYQVTIHDADRIRKEIEKRMLMTYEYQ